MTLELERRSAEPRDLAVLAPLCDLVPLSREISAGRAIVWVNDRDVAVGAYSVERTRPALRVHGFALSEPYRGRGIAARMLRELIDEAIRASATVVCEVPTDAARALQLLRHLGFVPAPGASPGSIRLVWRAG